MKLYRAKKRQRKRARCDQIDLRQYIFALFVRQFGSQPANVSAMTSHALSSLRHSPQVVAEWVNLLREDLEWDDPGRAYMLLREVLHAVRDYLSVDEAADLSAQLPLLVRGIYFDGWVPSRAPAQPRSKADFLGRIQKPFSETPLDDPERAAAAVFDVLRRKISQGEFDQVSRSMPKTLRDLWL